MSSSRHNKQHSNIPYHQLLSSEGDQHDHDNNKHSPVHDKLLEKAKHSMEKTSRSSSFVSSLSHEVVMKIFSAIFYASTSFWIIVVNKIVLTKYSFPSANVLGFGQMIATIIVLFLGKLFQVISFPAITSDLPSKIFPLPLLYIGNLMFGLSGTQRLSLPMFTVLRRFTILMTLILEYSLLGVEQSLTVTMTVFGMIGGAIIAAVDDLAFDLKGYSYVLGNDICTAANGVYLKKKLDSKELGKYGLMYYNSLFMLLPLLLLIMFTENVEEISSFKDWSNFWFVISFLSSCLMGFLLMWSTVLCTHYNSALTTTIIGCLKNILVTYFGMYVGGDYVFSFTNFLGVNISMFASLVYSYVTFIQRKPAPVAKQSSPQVIINT